jgi:glycosyltransferase involved in cell wall biosynthesis
MIPSTAPPQDRPVNFSRLFQVIALVVILQPALFKSVRETLYSTFSPVDQSIKISSQGHVWSNCKDLIIAPKQATEHPSSLIMGALKSVLNGRSNLRVSGGSSNVIVNMGGGKLRQILPNAIPRTQACRRDDITMLTFLSVSRLSQLMLQIQRWKGPISAAVVVTCESEMNVLLDFVRANEDLLQMTSFHILVERSSDSFPYNILRNVAMREAETDYVLAVDVDFVTEGYDRLLTLVRENVQVKEALHSHRLLVLPAFENTKAGIEVAAVPRSKDDVFRMVQEGLIAPFQIHRFSRGHSPTNFTKYYENATDVIYDIEYKKDFEPYVIGYRHGMPRYWNDFRSYYFNKCSYFLEAHLMGYKFSVLRDFFVFHMGQSGLDNNGPNIPLKEQEKNWKFHEYLATSYGLPLSGKFVSFVSEEEILL